MMKQTGIGILLLLLTAAAALAQDQVTTATLTGTTCPGAGCVSLDDINNPGSGGLQLASLSGTVTVEFESSTDCTTWTALPAVPSAAGTTVTSATGNGAWVFGAAGYCGVRARASANTGSIVATIRVSSGSQVARVTATDLDIRNLTFAGDKADVSGSTVNNDVSTSAVFTAGGADDLLPLSLNGHATVNVQAVDINAIGPVTLFEASGEDTPTVFSPVTCYSYDLGTFIQSTSSAVFRVTCPVAGRSQFRARGTTGTGTYTVNVRASIGSNGVIIASVPVTTNLATIDGLAVAVGAGNVTPSTQRFALGDDDTLNLKIPFKIDGRMPVTSGINFGDTPLVFTDPVFPLGGVYQFLNQWIPVDIDLEEPEPASFGMITRQVGLPAAAALVDNTANPTLTKIQTFPMKYVPADANWDMWDGTVKELRPATPTTVNVAASVTSVTCFAANANALARALYNDSTSDLMVKLGATASSTSFTIKVFPDGYFPIPGGYTGVVDCIWTSAVGAARTTELAQ